jgi:Holliday junction resolvase
VRLKARVDSNQKKIVSELRKMGCSILHTHQLGKGAPDIIVGYNGNNYLIEIKDGSKTLSQQRLTRDELQFQSNWNGSYFVCNSVEQIKEILLCEL